MQYKSTVCRSIDISDKAHPHFSPIIFVGKMSCETWSHDSGGKYRKPAPFIKFMQSGLRDVNGRSEISQAISRALKSLRPCSVVQHYLLQTSRQIIDLSIKRSRSCTAFKIMKANYVVINEVVVIYRHFVNSQGLALLCQVLSCKCQRL